MAKAQVEVLMVRRGWPAPVERSLAAVLWRYLIAAIRRPTI